MIPLIQTSLGLSEASPTIPVASLIETAMATARPTETPLPGDGEKLQEWSSLIGIVTAIVGNVLIALALNVQRYAHTRLHKERASLRRRARAAVKRTQSTQQAGSYGAVADRTNGNANVEGDPLSASYHSSATTETGDDDDASDYQKAGTSSNYLKSPYWWLGQILITLGEMGNFLAYGFAPASIVSPLGVVALVSNCLIAPLMFHERFRHRDFWGVVIAVGGVVTVVLSAKTEEVKLKPSDIWDSITTLAFEIYMAVTIFLILVLMWASPRFGRQTILVDLGLVGLFGGYTVLSTKGVSSMLSSTLWGAFTTPVTYVLLFILLGTAVMQIRYVNKALQRFDSTQVIPIQFVMFTLCVILGSAILYRDFEKTTAEQAGKFVGGCLLTFFGVFLITSGRGHGSGDDDDEDCLSNTDGVEETIGLLDQEGNPQDMSDQDSIHGGESPSRRPSKYADASIDDAISPGVPSLQISEPASTPDDESRAYPPNPWAAGPVATPPRGARNSRTLSADTVMRGSSVLSSPIRSNPTTPLRERQSLFPGSPPDPVTPQNKANTFGPSHHHNHRSGPFISPSPLSSTVTTVMKDGFLRGGNNNTTGERRPSQKPSIRHMRSMLRASLFFSDEEMAAAGPSNAGGSVAAVSDSNLIRPRTQSQQQPQIPEEGTRTRARSMSDTIGDFFRPKKSRRKEGDPNADVDENED